MAISKKRKAANEKIEAGKLYTLEEAMALVKQVNTAKFDASVDVHMHLGIDPRKADQALRGTVSLPHGTGKTKRVLVFCTPDVHLIKKTKQQPQVRTSSDWMTLLLRFRAVGQIST